MTPSYDTKPTAEYTTLQAAFDFFNTHLFAGMLPDCLITLQRKRGAKGYFWASQFTARGGAAAIDEIALNPEVFASRTDAEILSTLVHEMCHLWQQHFGTPSRSAYHNKEWALQMLAVGLVPSHTGKPGGKTTGQAMTHYIDPTGPFAQRSAELISQGTALRWQAAGRSRVSDAGGTTAAAKKASKTKYSCDSCGMNAWAKPAVRLICGDCEEPMRAV